MVGPTSGLARSAGRAWMRGAGAIGGDWMRGAGVISDAARAGAARLERALPSGVLAALERQRSAPGKVGVVGGADLSGWREGGFMGAAPMRELPEEADWMLAVQPGNLRLGPRTATAAGVGALALSLPFATDDWLDESRVNELRAINERARRKERQAQDYDPRELALISFEEERQRQLSERQREGMYR